MTHPSNNKLYSLKFQIYNPTCQQRPYADKTQLVFVALTDLTGTFTFEQRPPAFKEYFWVFP